MTHWAIEQLLPHAGRMVWLDRVVEWDAERVVCERTVRHGDLEVTAELPVLGLLGTGGATAPKRTATVVAPRPQGGQVAITVTSSNGDYRAGDEIWCDMIEGDFARALNRDVLVPRPAGRFLFGRLIDRDEERLQLLPLGSGGRQQIVANPPWIAITKKLVRNL